MNIYPTQQNYNNRQQIGFGTNITLADDVIKNFVKNQKVADKVHKIVETAAKDGKNIQLKIDLETTGVDSSDIKKYAIGHASYKGTLKDRIMPGLLSYLLGGLPSQMKSVYKQACKVMKPIIIADEAQIKLKEKLKQP